MTRLIGGRTMNGKRVTRAGSEVVYRYPMPWWYWLLLLAPGPIWAVLLLMVLPSAFRYGWGPPPPWLVFRFALWVAVLTAAPAWALVRRLAMQNNAWVRLDEEGVAVSDWRGRVARLGWGDVREMYWRLGKASAPASTIYIRGPDRTLHIPVMDLRGHTGPLVKEIAARAGLRCVHEGRFDLGARYEA